MSNAFASALEISAKIIRENLGDGATARRLIGDRLRTVEDQCMQLTEDNNYLLNMREGFKAALAGLFAIVQREER